MHRLLNANKTLLAGGKFGRAESNPASFVAFLRKLPARTFNAMFTPMGRKNLAYSFKRAGLWLDAGYRRDGSTIFQLTNGETFVLHRGNQLSELIYLEGAYEPLETQIVAKAIQPGDVVLDLGANIGYFTALLNSLVQPNGQVHAFEPGRGTFAKLEATRRLLKLARSVLHPEAIGDTIGQIDFWSSTSGSDAQQNTVRNAALGRHLRRDRVDATTLDAFTVELQRQGAPAVAFVKCDIEGAELSMLKGATRLLNSTNPPIWLIEHNRSALADHGATSAHLLQSFGGHDIYFVPICWPPSHMASPQAARWNGVPENLPDECNLVILPCRGTYSTRAAILKHAGLLGE
jgi:FkbM family methyltransferase